MNRRNLSFKKRLKCREQFFLLLFIVLSMHPSLAQPFATWAATKLMLDNGVVQRAIQLPAKDSKFVTTSYHPKNIDFKYFADTNTDFQFELNGSIYAGNGQWLLKNIVRHTDRKEGDGAAVTLISADKQVELTIRFLLYPHLPVIRKDLVITNLGKNNDVGIRRCGKI